MTNRLAGETSPYLLQHAENPVDWYPWGPEALERARSKDRPILLSIGYAACHWCHVMEHESFDDPDVAAVMNERFVNIKVDREERPDLDGIYMNAVQAITGRGGWPLTAFLTPDGRPFYGGTYFPPSPRQGMPSFRQVLDAVHDAWTERRGEVEGGADRLTADLRAATERSAAAAGDADAQADEPSPDHLLEAARRTLGSRFDPERGGFGRAPKFPQPVVLEFLLGRWAASGDDEALRMVTTTLDAMARGGMRDQLGGGFHRYSVDARWLVPHFEKMLYDNALLARVYAQAWSATGSADFRRVAEETLDDLLRTFRTEEGAFVSAHDADSEGVEGTFYLWSPDEIDEVARAADVAPEVAARFRRVHGVHEGGNFEGRSILHLPDGLAPHAARLGTTPQALRAEFAPLVRALREHRARREPPLVDTKVLTAWNAFAVRAFAEAGARFRRPDLVAVAERTARFLLDRLRPDGRLHRVWASGTARIPAFLDDHAALGNALLTLHAATLEPAWLTEARWCACEILDRFVDGDGRLWDTAHDAERLIVRPRDAPDTATPSGTSLAVEFLLRAGHLFGEAGWTGAADGWLRAERDGCLRFPSAFGRMLSQVERRSAAPVEIVIAGPAGSERDRLLAAAWAGLHPARTIAGHGGELAGDLAGLPLFAGRRADTATAWVCHDHVCDAPTSDPAEVRRSAGVWHDEAPDPKFDP